MVQKIHLNNLLDKNVIKVVCVRLPRMTGYIKKFDDNVKIPFKACEKQVFKKYN